MQRTQKGFTLIEGLIALMVSVIGIVALLGLFPRAVANVDTAENITVANELLRQTLDRLTTPSPDINQALLNGSITGGFEPIRANGPDNIPNTADDGAEVGGLYGDFQRRITTLIFPATPSYARRVMIVVTIQWKSAHSTTGFDRRISMGTYALPQI